MREITRVEAALCECGHDRDWHWTGRGCAGGTNCTCRYYKPNETGETNMTEHAEYPLGYGIRIGDTILWKGPQGEPGTVTRVDYPAHLAYVEWPHGGGWETFDSLWVQTVVPV